MIYRVRHFDFWRGWVVQVSKDGRYWYHPREEVTYGILDSEFPNVYDTEDQAHTRIASLKGKRIGLDSI